MFVTFLMKTLSFRESSCDAWLDMAATSAVFWAILCTLKSPLCLLLRILRDVFTVVTRYFRIDINFISLFRCQLLRSFHSSKLTLGGTNRQFSGNLYFSKIGFILSFVFLLSQFFLVIFGNTAFAGFSRSESVSTQLIFEKSHSFILIL